MSDLRKRLKKLPGVSSTSRIVHNAQKALNVAITGPMSPFLTSAQPGTFYSPVPSVEDIPASIDKSRQEVAGVDTNEQGQLAMLDHLAAVYPELPFRPEESTERRYFFENENFSYCDAILLFTMMRHLRPRQVVEVGSGFSSALMLDTCEIFPDQNTALTFIDPYPDRLESLLRADDRPRCTILQQKVQDVPLATFEKLEANDILFIDSSHVVKLRSDVAFLVFEVLPRLRSGVVVHVHDVPWPFEYPLNWLQAGRGWNEAYFIRAFLQHNRDFEIVFWNDFMTTLHEPEMHAKMPLTLKRSDASPLVLPASSIWLRRR